MVRIGGTAADFPTPFSKVNRQTSDIGFALKLCVVRSSYIPKPNQLLIEYRCDLSETLGVRLRFCTVEERSRRREAQILTRTHFPDPDLPVDGYAITLRRWPLVMNNDNFVELRQ